MTIKQAVAMREMVENGGNMASAMRKAGYSEAMVKNPQKVTKSKGFKDVLLVMGISDKLLAKVLMDGLNATKVLPYKTSSNTTIIVPDFNAIHRYLETCLKLKGYDKPANSALEVMFINSIPRPSNVRYKEDGANQKDKYGL